MIQAQHGGRDAVTDRASWRGTPAAELVLAIWCRREKGQHAGVERVLRPPSPNLEEMKFPSGLGKCFQSRDKGAKGLRYKLGGLGTKAPLSRARPGPHSNRLESLKLAWQGTLPVAVYVRLARKPNASDARGIREIMMKQTLNPNLETIEATKSWKETFVTSA
ncbi:hypothetical protein EYF80_002481 [Liparis tanakae]|uniref:Uncharacterized protein n=1 Tax=Liparis tanakae TaxID=230148 RepID=A0A4Z2JAP0_9TELE|nr:hypothetical protein EYF80_002481 [Liparis tanakae]